MKRKNFRKKGDHLFTAFMTAFSLFFLVIATWSLATPLMASPDEPVQVAKAAAVVRGQLIGHVLGGTLSPQAIVKIPAAYANLGASLDCYQAKPAIPATCNLQHSGSKKMVPYNIYNARYQPLYYALVGWPTLFIQSTNGVYVMRFMSAALSALFLALAVVATIKWSGSRFLLAGIMIASTPSVLFFAGVVNPIGFEASVAICLWTSLMIVICERRRRRQVPKRLVALIAVSAGVESMVRSLSPLWVVLTLLIAIIAINKTTLTRLLHNTRVKVGAALASLGCVTGIAWIIIFRATDVVAAGYPVNKLASNWNILILTTSRTILYYRQILSYFGMLNVPSPWSVYVGWSLLLAALFLLALYYGTRRQRFSLIVLGVSVITIPIIIASSQARRLGIVWQGADSLPIFVGIPILTTAVIANSSIGSARILHRVGLPIVSLVVGNLSIVAFFAELQRYAVGIPGFSFRIFHSSWHPPLGVAGLCIAEILTTAMLISLFIKLRGLPKYEPKSYMTYELQGTLPRATMLTWHISR